MTEQPRSERRTQNRRARGREYLEIVTPAYPAAISYRGHYYQRSGSTLQELKGAALDRFILRKQCRAWDGVPVPNASPRSLSKAAVDAFRVQARRSERTYAADLREKTDDLLEKLDLWDGHCHGSHHGSHHGSPIPDKPNSRLQKYRITETGRARLAALKKER